MNFSLLRLELFAVLFLPGFLIVFLIGWARRRQGKPTFLKIGLWSALAGTLGVAVVFGLLTAFFLYATRTVVTDHSATPLTVAEARQLGCPIPLPNSAKNVRFAIACGGIQALEILVRFEAPPDVCRAQVQAVINANAVQNHENPLPANLHPLTTFPPRVMMEMFGTGKTSWFDVQNIVHGETEDITPYNNQQFWIDNDRGIFYYNYCD